ncbi:Nitroreductase family [Novymonas esmeraldas]|uniref:Nitroreductase family n=1 Tax=Novymonas esmeraldas TaxID=1808958 RepID=A0AAW0EM66_9TRYP
MGCSESKAAEKATAPRAAPSAAPRPAPRQATRTSTDFLTMLAARRSVYGVGKKLPRRSAEVTHTIQAAIRACPSSFNVQSSRAVILYGAEHARVWDIVKAALKRVTSAEQYAQSAAKVDGCFAAGAGTVLFYEDRAAVKGQQDAYPAYAANFPVWSQHSSAMAQLAVWTALAQDGIGATLQHYNELIEADLRAAFDVPADWQLVAQMPFGSIETPAAAKTHIADAGRFIVRGE